MNLLPHKSWHVYNKANIERVKKDEAEVERIRKEKNDRAQTAEREHRLSILRKRVRSPSDHSIDNKLSSTTFSEESNDSTSSLPLAHFTLFPELEKLPSTAPIPIIDSSKPELKKKHPSVAANTKEPVPWYHRPKSNLISPDRTSSRVNQKNYEDPLYQMRPHQVKVADNKPSASSSSSSSASIGFDLQQLREERLHRQQEERSRLRNSSNALPLHLRHTEKSDIALLDKHTYSDTFQSSATLKEMRYKKKVDSQNRKRVKKN